MASYTDTPQINALYLEQQQISNALQMLDEGGSVPSFVVAPATQQSPEGYPMPTTQMAVSISTIAPSQELLNTAYDALIQRHNAIAAELNSLGVPDAPTTEVRKLNDRKPREKARA